MTFRDAYDSALPRGEGPVFTRVYRRGGRYAHLRDEGASLVLCPAWRYRVVGVDPSWLGTGDQSEYDKAAGKPTCPACFRVREAAQAGIGTDQADPAERGRQL